MFSKILRGSCVQFLLYKAFWSSKKPAVPGDPCLSKKFTKSCSFQDFNWYWNEHHDDYRSRSASQEALAKRPNISHRLLIPEDCQVQCQDSAISQMVTQFPPWLSPTYGLVTASPYARPALPETTGAADSCPQAPPGKAREKKCATTPEPQKHFSREFFSCWQA